MPEVQVTGFQYTHDLQADGRFAVERDAGGGNDPRDQSQQRVGTDRQFPAFNQGIETVHQRVSLE